MSASSECYLKEYDVLRAFCFVIFKMTIISIFAGSNACITGVDLIDINRDYRKSRGFTLFEVIIMVALTVLVMTLVYTTLYYGGRSTARTRVNILKKQDILKQFHQIRFQLINLYHSDGICLEGKEGRTERKSEVYFLTTSLKYRKGVGEVGYKMITDYDGKTYLAYTEFPYARENRFALNNHMDKWYVASEMIKGFTAEYRSPTGWAKAWDGKNPPRKIRITLWYKEEADDKTLTPYRFIVTPGIKSVF